MEKHLKCVLQLSLKEMALRRVAVLLWNASDIFASFSTYERDFTERWIKFIEVKVKDKIPELNLPKLLKNQMNDIVRPIGLEMRRWKLSHHKFFSWENRVLPASVQLCWTTNGTINLKKTAEALVKCEEFGVLSRYKLACCYCLENYILNIWEELPEHNKNSYNEALYRRSFADIDLECCWPDILKGNDSKYAYFLAFYVNLTSLNQWAFQHSAKRGNKTEAEYFFHKLTREEREASLVRTVKALIDERNFDFFYLLCLMTPEQQMELVKEHPHQVLLCFLYWPWQCLFMENVSLVWSYLNPTRTHTFLYSMAKKFISANHHSPKLFREFFVWGVQDLKEVFVGEEFENEYIETPACVFLMTFFSKEDSESVEVIFRNVDDAHKVKLIFQHRILKYFHEKILEDRWDMVKVCVRDFECRESKKRLKKVLAEMHEKRVRARSEQENRNLESFFDFLDGTNTSAEG